MAQIYVARRVMRKAVFFPMQGTKQNPSLIFPMTAKTEMGEMDELVRRILEKRHITNEKEVQALVANAEQGYEDRRHLQEARKELHRLMDIKAKGGKLMQKGFRQWKQVFYRPVAKKEA